MCGSVNNQATIELNGNSVRISKNLWDFLIELRAQMMVIFESSNGEETTDTPLDTISPMFWCDMICIDQTFVRERDHQVQMMDQIYADAEEVWAWLGYTAHTPETTQYSRNVQELHSARDEKTSTSEQRLRCPKPLWDSPYWNRRWIVQELLAAKHIVIHTNDEVWSWIDVRMQLARVPTDDKPDAIHRIFDARYRKQFDSEDAGLLDLLTTLQASKCSDVRDKIFSLFKISKEHRDGRRLAVSYRKAVPQIFFETLVYLDPIPSEMIPVARRLARILELDFEDLWRLVNVPGGYLLSAIPSNVTFVVKLRTTGSIAIDSLPYLVRRVLKPTADLRLQIWRDEAFSAADKNRPAGRSHSICSAADGDLVILTDSMARGDYQEVTLVCTRDELDRLKPHAFEFNDRYPIDSYAINVRVTKRQLLLAMSNDGQLPRNTLDDSAPALNLDFDPQVV